MAIQHVTSEDIKDVLQEPLFDINAAARLLDISPWTLRNWVRDRRIEFVKVGRLVRFRPATIYARINDGVIPEGGRAA